MRLKFFKCTGLKEDICVSWDHLFDIDSVYPSLIEHERDDVLILSSKKDESQYWLVDASQFIEIDKYEVAVTSTGSFVHNTNLRTEDEIKHIDMLVSLIEGQSDPAAKPSKDDALRVINMELEDPDTAPERVDELLDRLNELKSMS